MTSHLSQPKSTEQECLQEERVCAIKICNFDLQLSSENVSTKFSNEEKIMKRREMVQTTSTRYNRERYDPKNDRKVWSSQSGRASSKEKLSKLHQLQQLNQQIQIIAPILEDKVVKLKSLISRKPSHSQQASSQMRKIHFTQYVLRSSSPSTPAVLHSRRKKECSFMKAVKAKKLMNKSMEEHAKREQLDLFKSIQLNNSSKYASSKKIAFIAEDLTDNLKSFKNKKMLAKPTLKNYIQRRQSHLTARHNVLSPRKGDEECRPWETHRLDHLDDHDHLIQF